MVHACMAYRVARKIRVETYLQPGTVSTLGQKEESMSEWIREAVNEKLERESQ